VAISDDSDINNNPHHSQQSCPRAASSARAVEISTALYASPPYCSRLVEGKIGRSSTSKSVSFSQRGGAWGRCGVESHMSRSIENKEAFEEAIRMLKGPTRNSSNSSGRFSKEVGRRREETKTFAKRQISTTRFSVVAYFAPARSGRRCFRGCDSLVIQLRFVDPKGDAWIRRDHYLVSTCKIRMTLSLGIVNGTSSRVRQSSVDASIGLLCSDNARCVLLFANRELVIRTATRQVMTSVSTRAGPTADRFLCWNQARGSSREGEEDDSRLDAEHRMKTDICRCTFSLS
jgi:hypothetical protein